MTWFKDKHGLAAFAELPSHEMEERMEQGQSFYATLTGVAMNEGVEVTVLKSFGATPVYDSVVALARGSTAGLEPVGVVAQYGVEYLDGEAFHPPRHGEDVREAFWEGELQRCGERRFHIAHLDTSEVSLFFIGKRPSDAQAQLAAAVRRLYPEEVSIFTAIDNIEGLSIRTGSAIGSPDDRAAGCILRTGGEVSFYLGADDIEIEQKMQQDTGAADPGDRIEIGFTWVNDALIDSALCSRTTSESNFSM